MRCLPILFVLGCSSTRQLAAPADPRLRVPGHTAGFVVATTTPWHERIDPNTVLRLRNGEGAWSDALAGREVNVDANGVWLARSRRIEDVADRIAIEGVSARVAEQIERARPAAATLVREGDALVLGGERAVLAAWIAALEDGVAEIGPRYTPVDVCEARAPSVCTHLEALDAMRYRLLYVYDGAPLGTWRVHTVRQGWWAPLQGAPLVAALVRGRDLMVGWRWAEVQGVEVTNLSGGKTLAAVAATAAVGVALAPLALLGGGLGGHGGGGSSGSGGIASAGRALDAFGRVALSGAAVPAGGGWTADLADTELVDARPLFSTGSRVRSIARFTASLEGGGATAGDYAYSGASARARFADVFELGGGVHVSEARGAEGWTHSTQGVFHVGLHLPLDAGFRFAIPLAFEAARGGGVAHDLRLPWGVRYTAPSGHWFATVSPATPQHLRLRDMPAGRWSLLVGAEVGASF